MKIARKYFCINYSELLGSGVSEEQVNNLEWPYHTCPCYNSFELNEDFRCMSHRQKYLPCLTMYII